MLRTHIIIFTAIILCIGAAFNGEGMDGKEGDQRMKTLRPCPSSPNCVASQSSDPQHRMDPIPFSGPRETAQARLWKILQAMPRSEITKEEPGYLAVSFRSRIFGFVDESEFAFDEKSGLVHFRSGARTGYYDFGVNRSRMRRISEAFKADE
jgi:uncharacterized protein (DUF1499 family)